MTKDEILVKLQDVVAKEPVKWLEDAENRAANKNWIKRSQSVAIKVLSTLRERGITQKELASLMQVSPQLVNKWVKGKENFTFETISRLEEALDIELLQVVEAHQSVAKNSIELSYSVYPTTRPVRITKRGTVSSKCIPFVVSTRDTAFSEGKNNSRVG